VLRDRAEEEERSFFREQARLLAEQARAQTVKARADAIKYAEEHAEDILRRRGLSAVPGLGSAGFVEKENNFKAGKTAAVGVSKKKSKKKKQVEDDEDAESTPEATSESSEEPPDRVITTLKAKPKPKPKDKPAKVPVRSAGLPKKPRKGVKPALTLPDVPEDELVDDFPVDFGLGSPVPTLDDDNDLLNILSQDKASDDSDIENEPSMASLILPVSAASPARVRSQKVGPRALTPTPQKRKRKHTALDDEDFDFTKKGEKKRAALAELNQVDEEPEPVTVTPKKALKRRKELEKERLERLNDIMAKRDDAGVGRAQSLMDEVATSGVAKVKKAVSITAANGRANGVAGTRPKAATSSGFVASTRNESAQDDLASQQKSKTSEGNSAEDGNARFSTVTVRKKGTQGKNAERNTNGAPKGKQQKGKKATGADITVQASDPHDESNGDSTDDVGATKPPIKRPKKSVKDKRSKLNEVELALRKAEMLTRISQMQQEVATPKVIKKKKVIKKATSSTLATKRTDFQQILTNAPASNANTQDAAPPTPPKQPTPPPEKLQFLQFTKGLSKSPMPFNLRSRLKSPVLASPMRKRPREQPNPSEEPNDDVGMASPTYSYGNATSPRDSLADFTRATTSNNAARQIAVGITTRPKKKKTATAPKVNRFGVPGGLIASTASSSSGSGAATGGSFSMFDAFVNTSAAPIPRLKTMSSGDMSPVV
jgi:hypothetical protein